MKTGTDPDIFFTHVWHLAKQVEFIGGTVTKTKRADIFLQGLPAEYGLKRYNASAVSGYDLDKIEQTARNLWNTRNRNNGTNGTGMIHRGHRSSAGNTGFTATIDR